MKSVYFPDYTIGTDAYDAIPALCGMYGKTAVIIGGEKSRAAAEPLIRKACEGHVELAGSFQYGDNATVEHAERLTHIEEIRKADMIFAVGGGRACDTAKWAAHLLDKPVFTFPTLASNCASTSSLSVLYYPDGKFRDMFRCTGPALHTFINLNVIATAPSEYLWAGLGDALSKQYEVEFAARGRALDFVEDMGAHYAKNVAAGLLKYGADAMHAAKRGEVTEALEYAAENILISPSLATLFLPDELGGSLAHAIYNSHTGTPHKGHHLHGAVVAYGLLVLLTLDGQREERDKVYAFARSIALPTKMEDIGIMPNSPEEEALLRTSLTMDDAKPAPYDITYEMLIEAVRRLDALSEAAE